MADLDEERLAELREFFDDCDVDHSDRIDRVEFGKLLDSLEADMSREEADIGFGIIDTDNNGSIDFEEFVAWWTDRG